jgi:hypothetical protein
MINDTDCHTHWHTVSLYARILYVIHVTALRNTLVADSITSTVAVLACCCIANTVLRRIYVVYTHLLQ